MEQGGHLEAAHVILFWCILVQNNIFFLPSRYPDSWYRDITSNKKFFSLAATYRGSIVGMIVAEIKSRTKVHKEV